VAIFGPDLCSTCVDRLIFNIHIWNQSFTDSKRLINVTNGLNRHESRFGSANVLQNCRMATVRDFEWWGQSVAGFGVLVI